MSATTKPTALDRITRAAKNRVMTYAQVRYPGLAGTVVRSITSGGSKKKGGVGGGVAKHTAPAERYAPAGNGRTSGIVAAQAAAAPLPR
ncbi:hypothetical protein [Corynebacterium qintianiae]|uniref:hypothetical protein n=1 Tax=Corynebacterium qintianiae TaxID=2709392 RepID=UPI0013ECE31C|nr:hypothetical protein [Corynebacterium qintianiae]